MPATSDLIVGTTIADAALPLSKARRVSDKGAHMQDLLHKRSEDTLDYFIDLMKWLEPDENITGCTAYTTTEQDSILVVDRLHFAPTGVVVWIKGGGNESRYTVYCTVQTSLGKVKLFTFVMLTRARAGAPALGVSSSALGFGEVLVNETSTATVTLTNTGALHLTITSVAITGEFTLTGGSLPRTLAPSASVPLTFTFRPTSAGAKTGVATIISDAPSSPVPVALYGTGILLVVPPDDALLTDGGLAMMTHDGLVLVVVTGPSVPPPPLTNVLLLEGSSGDPLLTENDLMLEV